MNSPIFPSCNYMLAVTSDVGLQKSIAAVCADIPVRVIFCSGLTEIQSKLKIIRRVAGILIFPNGLGDLEVAQIAKLAETSKVPICHSSKSEMAAAASSDKYVFNLIDSFIKTLVPKGLEAALLDACNTLMPSFFVGLGKFGPAGLRRPLAHHNCQVIYSVVADSLLGYCSIKAKTSDLLSDLDSTSVLLEATNQCIGLIVQALAKLGLNARIGLPILFDLKKIPEIQPLLFFPSVSIADPKNIIDISLGFFHFEGTPLFDLTSLSVADDTGGIEFL